MAVNNHSYAPLIPPPDYTPRSTTTTTTTTSRQQQDAWDSEASLPPYSPSATTTTTTETTTVSFPPRPVSAHDALLYTLSSDTQHIPRGRSASPPPPPRRLEPLAPPATAWPLTSLSHIPPQSRPISTRRVPEKFYTNDNPTQASSSPSSSSAQPSPSSFLRNPLRSISSYRRDRESRKKVDYYERVYGFVPKNVMSEAEWRAAREAAPKVGPRVKSRGGPVSSLFFYRFS